MRLVADRGHELFHRILEIEIRALAARVEADGDVDLWPVEVELAHQLARGGDLGFRHAAVGLGDVAHHFERCREEPFADFERRAARSRAARIDGLIIEVADEDHDEHSRETADDAQRTPLLRCMAHMLPATPTPPVHTTSLKGLSKIHTGKVRDIYEVDAQSMLIVTTDRLSAFDVVMQDPIPEKGRVLNSISNFCFARTGHIVPNHLTGRNVDEIVS